MHKVTLCQGFKQETGSLNPTKTTAPQNQNASHKCIRLSRHLSADQLVLRKRNVWKDKKNDTIF
jgi:hypothetical protein